MTAAAFRATVHGLRTVPSRKVLQLTLEAPIEELANIAAICEHGAWMGVARIQNPPDDLSGGKEAGGAFRPGSASPPPLVPEAPKARRHWDDLSPAQQCGIRCADPIFRKFLEENYGQEFNDEGSAAMFMRDYFRIESRSDLTAKHWSAFDKTFQAWKVADRVGA